MELELFGVKLYTPKFDFIFECFNKQKQLPHKYMKYFIFFSVILGMKFLFKHSKNILNYIVNNIKLKLYFNFPIKEKNRWVVILGFGDNLNSVTLAKYFGSRHYNLLLLVDNNVLKVRKQYNLNQIQEINKLNHVNILEYDYESFIKADDFDLESGLIEYIIDTSVLRLYNADLSKEDKESHLKSIFYNEAISTWLEKYSKVMDRLRLYFNIRDVLEPLRIFIFNYPDKSEEVNHKIFYDIRKALYMNYQEVYKGSVFFCSVKFNNEFKGYYISEKKLKCLEMIHAGNKEDCLFKSGSQSNSDDNIIELNFL